MYGAIIGDIVGSPFEYVSEHKTKKFKLFSKESDYTDDSVMTVAVAEALMRAGRDAPAEKIAESVRESMLRWGRKYPDAGYGGRFYEWLNAESPQPYDSFGNGSAMRVSAAGWLYGSLERTREVARATAVPTHNHPEGIKGAEAVASVIFCARNGRSKAQIKDFIEKEFGYDLSKSCDEIRPTYAFDETCQGTVPQAICAFLEGESFENVIRTAASLGGDCDTLTAIAGSMAEALYPIPKKFRRECDDRLSDEMLCVVSLFYATVGKSRERERAENAADGSADGNADGNADDFDEKR